MRGGARGLGNGYLENLNIFVVQSFAGFFFLVFRSFRAAPEACGGSQARGLIRVVATSLHYSYRNMGAEPCVQPTPQLLNPLSKARDRTCNLMVPTQISFHCAMT